MGIQLNLLNRDLYISISWIIILYNILKIRQKSAILLEMREVTKLPCTVRLMNKKVHNFDFSKRNMIKSDYDENFPPVIQNYSIKLENYNQEYKNRLSRP